ncbi:MAG: type I 3-dehydroquinate dehydratase [Chthoniobacterales bacterium]
MKRTKKRTPRACLVVATAHTARGLREAAALRPKDGVDLVEVRLDCIPGSIERLGQLIRKINLPLIITARHPQEGGAGGLGAAARGRMLEALLPQADFVDVELRSVPSMRSVLARAKRSRVNIIVSFHDFAKTPAPAALRKKIKQARGAGASIVKIATTLRSPRDLSALVELQNGSADVATMGMGPLGKISRLALPLAGARLVYGYLDRPQVNGQWPAKLLAARLAEVAS